MSLGQRGSGFHEDLPEPAEEALESPHHGFQGDREPAAASPVIPTSLTIAVSREAGSRGNTIGNRAGQKLGWPVYNQELLEYIAQEGAFRQRLLENLPAETTLWVEDNLANLLREQDVSHHPSIINLARIVLSLGAQGGVVLIGRGAGTILPRETTLHVRIVAPLNDRIAYMSQWLRLTVEAAAGQVRIRDARRAEFLSAHFHRQPGDVDNYDMVLNSSYLGEDLCAELICQTARAKLNSRDWPGNSAPTPVSVPFE